jgi:hypothetical protein
MPVNYSVLATGAFSFALALAWNDAVSSGIRSMFPTGNVEATAHAKFAYAIIVTVFVIVVVSALDHARRVAHGRGEALAPHRAGIAGILDTKPPLRPAPDCAACAEHCGGEPVVRLWSAASA